MENDALSGASRLNLDSLPGHKCVEKIVLRFFEFEDIPSDVEKWKRCFSLERFPKIRVIHLQYHFNGHRFPSEEEHFRLDIWKKFSQEFNAMGGDLALSFTGFR